MINPKPLQKIIPILTLFLIVTSCTQNQNWPQFRGLESNNISTAKSLPLVWGDDNNILWKYKIDGTGFSSPIVWGEKVFITSVFPVKVNTAQVQPMVPPPAAGGPNGAQGIPPQGGTTANPSVVPQAGQNSPPPPPALPDTAYLDEIYRWNVTCVDLNTGKELWKQVAYEGAPKANKHAQSNYATQTPVTDGSRVYASFGMNGLFCYDLEGNLLWKKDIDAFETANGWGTGSSPVLYDGVLYLQNDNEVSSSLIALDAVTGDERWKVERSEKTTYSTPFIWKNKLRTELILMGKTVCSYDLQSGTILWQINLGGEPSIPMPAADKERILLGNPSGMKPTSKLISVLAGAEGDISIPEGVNQSEWVEWTQPEAGLGNGTPVLYNGLLYYLESRGGRLNVLNASTGEKVYNTRFSDFGAVWSSPWAYDGKIGFYDEKGNTRIIKAGEPFDVLSENKLSDTFWPSVAITGDALIIKGAEWLYCVKN